MFDAAGSIDQNHYQARTLKIYLYYRFMLAALLFSMHFGKVAGGLFGKSSPDLFYWTSLGYVAIGLLTLLTANAVTLTRSINLISSILIIDLISLTTLIHASGGLESGLGYLLLIPAATASMFIPGLMAHGFAALTCFFLIGESIYISRNNAEFIKNLFPAGTLGFLVFFTSVTFQFLTERIRTSTLEARKQSLYAERLEQLAQHIVTRMRTGIIVVNDLLEVELLNQSALQLLDQPGERQYIGKHLSNISNLDVVFRDWLNARHSNTPIIHTLDNGHEIRISFACLDMEKNISKTILYVEDYRAFTQHAQQLKLASLGRLTASIAHEVRNPLGAISHAAQLLSESEELASADKRLTEIILNNSERVNQIIENTLVLSKRKSAKPELINLKVWLTDFISEYTTTSPGSKIDYDNDSGDAKVRVDPTHLRQVLTNLCDNGLRYSKQVTGLAKIDLKSGLSQNSETTYVDVIDYGDGIAPDKLQHIFEPFYTTDTQGSGLGLYISRELCEINQATLNYLRTEDNKSRFRLNFSHHQRMT
ncbi:MAG: two-component sensor histidine kinase [Alteromonadaceae bacterium]|nr:MAG: two-component sensor histidine kinase [Alteromonadaceae bacterium]